MYNLYCNDCLNVDLVGVKLVYLDPPYSFKSEDKYYGVGDSLEEYLAYMGARLAKIRTCLAFDSNLVIHVDFKIVHNIKVLCDDLFGRENFRNEIIWCYSNPSVAKRYLPRKHDNLLWYGFGDYTFNQPHIPYTNKLTVGGNTGWSEKKDTSEYTDKGKKLEDWWVDIPALCRNEGEKVGYATQKPLKLMTRVIASFSNPNDDIYDPFCGSGSFLHAGLVLQRNCYGADKSEEAIAICRKRLEIFNE